MHTPVDPTGQQIRLAKGDVTAHIAQVGASLRGLTVGGVSVVTPFPEGTMAPSCSGAVLVPWPNRIADGIWKQTDPHGTEYEQELALTEPDLDNAIHGLLRFAPYVVEAGEEKATLTAAVVPQNGYPFALVTEVEYALTDDGITVTHTLTNVGDTAAPVGVGTHPFFHIGGADPRELTLTLPASRFFEVDERLLPVAERDVTGDTDLRAGRRLGDVSLDTGFAGLDRDDEGRAVTTLESADGTKVSVWQDENFEYLQVYTTENYPGQDYAVAIEPMTIPTDGFNSGDNLTWLEPGASWNVSWGVSVSTNSGVTIKE
ncbi:aldose 1-epimerase [Microbacterium nanhaiense]|uniref:Aldose 1-epimerase n=1 Tax=Microbacterium nanhaiense TaxID=1301026 RepID=A0ABQ2N2V9_9MICO|nr:aldose 1-epimerase family protein [Microbacterium nanhaiense]GGO64704.1 aldose 1-epimerase [Microbacterium nanhaiense]